MQRVSPGEERPEQLCGQALCDLVCYYGALCDAHERSQGAEQRCGRGRVGGQEACGERLQRPEACRNVELRGAYQELLYTLDIVVSAWGDARQRNTHIEKERLQLTSADSEELVMDARRQVREGECEVHSEHGTRLLS